MEIKNTLTVDAPIDRAWEVMTDIPLIAPCLPGAKLTGEEDGVYSGSVKVKVGPITAEYKGSAEFVEKDDVAHKAVISGKGRDSRGAGNAQAEITATMHQSGDQTIVEIVTDLKISGKVAQFGRGVMQDVSEKLLGQFAECIGNKFEAAPAEAASDTATTSSTDTVAAAATAASNGAAVGSSAAASSGVGSAAASTAEAASSDDDDVLDLLDVAGDSVLKRFAPAAGGAALLALLVALVRRRRRS